MYDKDSIKESLTIEEIFSIVEEFGGNPSQHGSMLVCDTICHNHPGEGSRKLYYYDNTKLFNCFSGCHEYFDIYQLVIKVFGIQNEEEISMPKAVSFVARKTGKSAMLEGDFDEMVTEDWSVFKDFEKKKEKEKSTRELKEYNEDILCCMPRPKIAPWLREGISQEALDKFEISYYPEECQIVIPHRDINNRLIGIRGRTMVKEDGEKYGKYRPLRANGLMYNHPLGFSLYGLNLSKSNIAAVKKAIIFEGEKSAMLYASYFGFDNNISVATCGSSLSPQQFELLFELGVEEIIIAYDKQFKEIGDDEFKVCVKNLRRIADKYKSFVTVSCLFDKESMLDYKSSPIDHGKDVFLELFKKRIIL